MNFHLSLLFHTYRGLKAVRQAGVRLKRYTHTLRIFFCFFLHQEACRQDGDASCILELQ